MLGGCDLFMSLREAARTVGSSENPGCMLGLMVEVVVSRGGGLWQWFRGGGSFLFMVVLFVHVSLRRKREAAE